MDGGGQAPVMQQPPAYGAPAPGYGAPPGAPGYGAPGYGAPAYPDHGAAPGYGAPAGYAGPPPGYGGQPAAPGYGGPQMQQPPYGAPPQNLAAPGYAPAPAQAPPGCPPGLQYLSQVDQLLVKQKVEILEAFTGFETANKYKVLNSVGQEVYKAKEDTDCCTRQCCGPARPFDMNITDNTGIEVIHLNRPLRCQACCFPCCLQELEVSSPPGSIIGTVEQQWSILYPRFVIKDESGSPILKIEGPLCPCSCCGDVDFSVVTMDGQEVGKITKQWSGLVREAFSDADNFGISFPLDLDVKVKATLLGALFLIDFMYFEQQQNNNND